MMITTRAVRRLGPLDLLAAALLAAGLALVLVGVVPGPDAEATLGRIAPVLAAAVVLAELTARAEVFDVLAARVAILGRGSRAAGLRVPPGRLVAAGLLTATMTTTAALAALAALLTPSPVIMASLKSLWGL